MGKVFVILLLCLSAILHQGFRVDGEVIECFQCDSSVEGQEDCANSNLDVLDKFASECADPTVPETTSDPTETTPDPTESTIETSTETTVESTTETEPGPTESTTETSTETTVESTTETEPDTTESTTETSTETTVESTTETEPEPTESTTETSTETTVESTAETTDPPENSESPEINPPEKNDDSSHNSPFVSVYTRQRRSLQREEEPAPFKCFKYHEDDVVRRGCTRETQEEVCTSARSDCRVCGTGRCNSGVKMTGFSLLMVVLGAVLFFTG